MIMSTKAFCIACRTTDDIGNLYHLVDDDAYIHQGCLTQEWVDKLNLDVDANEIALAATASEPQPDSSHDKRFILRIIGAVIMAVAIFGCLGVAASGSIVSVHYSVLFATVWLTGLAMLLR